MLCKTDRADLPVEVMECIIGYCHGFEDQWGIHIDIHARYSTLRACALTCRKLYPKSRATLYSNVYFLHPSSLLFFVHTIRANPSLASHVGSIHPSYRVEYNILVEDQFTHLASDQLVLLASLSPHLLPHSITLEAYFLRVDSKLHEQAWEAFNRMTFARCLSLRNVNFEFLGQFLRILTAFPNVTTFVIQNISFERLAVLSNIPGIIEGNRGRHRFRTQPECIELRPGDADVEMAIVQWMGAQGGFIRVAQVAINPFNQDSMIAILKQSGPSLRTCIWRNVTNYKDGGMQYSTTN